MAQRAYFFIFLVFLSCNSTKTIIDNTDKNNGQYTSFKNPSFEDEPSSSHTPKGWENCGFLGESPPDVQPTSTFKVNNKPYDGKTYLGLVVRDVGTYESIFQKLSEPLKRDSTYTFSAYICRSTIYESLSQLTKRKTYYNRACILRIWGCLSDCQNGELLAVSKPITNSDWEKYNFKLKPTRQWRYLKLEAYYNGSDVYNGNILIDNLSDIYISR